MFDVQWVELTIVRILPQNGGPLSAALMSDRERSRLFESISFDVRIHDSTHCWRQDTNMDKNVGDALTLMATVTDEMAEDYLDSPKLIDDGSFRRARFDSPGRKHACILKSACMVNNLRATSLLVDQGWIHEAGTLFRQLNEINDDLHFLLENDLDDDALKDQREYLDEYFVEPFGDPENVTGTTRAWKPVLRRKVHSAGSRLLAEHGVGDPSTNQEMLTTMHKLYSSYAHASYATLMDVLFLDGDGKFVSGPRKDELRAKMMDQYVAILRACVVALALVAFRIGMDSRFQELRNIDARFARLSTP